MMQIERVEEKGRGKITVYLENGDFFTLYKKEAGQPALEPGAELDQDRWEKIRAEVLIPRARKRAMYLLEQMDRTEAKLREKLGQNGYPGDVIEDAVGYVKKFHYVDDFRYACNYVRSQGQSKSRRLLALELARKGVSRELAERALEEEYDGEDEGQKIRRWMEKKHYDPQTADVGEKRRMYQFLLRKGFRAGDILRELSLEGAEQ